MNANAITTAPNTRFPVIEFTGANDGRLFLVEARYPKPAFTPHLTIDATWHDATLRNSAAMVLHPKGRIDRYSAKAFRSRLLDAIEDSAGAVIVDFSGVEYIGGAGLEAVITATRKAQGAQVWFGVSNLRPAVGEVFKISKCHTVVTIFATNLPATGHAASPTGNPTPKNSLKETIRLDCTKTGGRHV